MVALKNTHTQLVKATKDPEPSLSNLVQKERLAVATNLSNQISNAGEQSFQNSRYRDDTKIQRLPSSTSQFSGLSCNHQIRELEASPIFTDVNALLFLSDSLSLERSKLKERSSFESSIIDLIQLRPDSPIGGEVAAPMATTASKPEDDTAHKPGKCEFDAVSLESLTSRRAATSYGESYTENRQPLLPSTPKNRGTKRSENSTAAPETSVVLVRTSANTCDDHPKSEKAAQEFSLATASFEVLENAAKDPTTLDVLKASRLSINNKFSKSDRPSKLLVTSKKIVPIFRDSHWSSLETSRSVVRFDNEINPTVTSAELSPYATDATPSNMDGMWWSKPVRSLPGAPELPDTSNSANIPALPGAPSIPEVPTDITGQLPSLQTLPTQPKKSKRIIKRGQKFIRKGRGVVLTKPLLNVVLGRELAGPTSQALKLIKEGMASVPAVDSAPIPGPAPL
jgi:hypothetical protein